MKSTKLLCSLFFIALFTLLNINAVAAQDPKTLIQEMVQEIGGLDKLYSMKDVEFSYTYQDLTTGQKDVSLERYVFDGELSWAQYEVREKIMMPQVEGELIQGYNGKESWLTLNGALSDDKQLNKFSDFARKTNFYWFAMMFKLLDPGIIYESQGTKTVDGVEYQVVKIIFEEGVGDAQDTYVLYINPDTKLVDQFLFTVMDFGMAEPHLMKVEYEEIAGLKLPTKRKYAPADWDGNLKNDNWTAEISTDVKFNNGFDKSMFDKPSS